MKYKALFSTRSILQLLILVDLILCAKLEKVLASFTSEIGACNYTYYSLHEIGDITIILTSLTGDADLYVSENTQHPDYTNYDLSSTTYGVDILNIPLSMKRPAGVGVYGHVHKPLSKYRLVAVLNYTGSYNDYDENLYSYSSDSDTSNGKGTDGGKFWVVSSFMWEILELIIKILAEVLMA